MHIQNALRKCQQYITEGYRFAVDLDLEQFFDTVNHDMLMGLLGRTIADQRLLELIGRYLRAGCGVDGVLRHQPVLQSGARAGRLDQTAHPYVLLETVALGAHEDQALAGLGRE